MAKQILIYDDEIARSRRFLPLTYTRPVAALRSGCYTGIERVRIKYPDAEICLTTDPLFAEVAQERYDVRVNEVPTGPVLLLNSREILQSSTDWNEDETTLSTDLADAILFGAAITLSEVKAPNALWGMVHANARTIESDMGLLMHGASEYRQLKPSQHQGVLIEGEIYVHLSATIGLGVILDATDGPIVIGRGVRIMPNAVVMGPAVIGDNSVVKAGAKIYEGTTIGPVCKVGGEIENAIFQGYANKQHDGYVGHSMIGEWCNLGADTNTSDLKNDYSNVRVQIEGEEIDTGSMFVGLLMGDHSKSAINTQFNTGTVVGVSSNIFDAGFPPKWIPSFSWGGAQGFQDYRYEKAMKVAEIVTGRRNVLISEAERRLFREIYTKAKQVVV